MQEGINLEEMLKRGESIEVPFSDGKKRKAKVYSGGVPEDEIKELSDKELEVLFHLSNAVKLLHPLWREQVEPKSFILQEVLKELERAAAEKGKKDILNRIKKYELALFSSGAVPYQIMAGGINPTLEAVKNEIEELSKGLPQNIKENYELIKGFLFERITQPEEANLYPREIDRERAKELAKITNSMVIKDKEGNLRVVFSEFYFKNQVGEVIKELKNALEKSKQIGNKGLENYISEVIKGLEECSKEENNRNIDDMVKLSNNLREDMYKAWLSMKSKIDFIISTALEQYNDQINNVLGVTLGLALIKSNKWQKYIEGIVSKEVIEQLNKSSPWNDEFKSKEIKERSLRAVYIVNASGDFRQMAFLAENLPNERWITQKHGAVQLFYMNTFESVVKDRIQALAKKFFGNEIDKEIENSLFDGFFTHVIMHEIGHSLGRNSYNKEANEVFGEDYSWLEEARAEIFSVFATMKLEEMGKVKEGIGRTALYSLITDSLKGLKEEPKQSHTKARNLIVHYMMDKGVLRFNKKTEFFSMDYEKAKQEVEELTRIIGNIKGSGDVERLKEIKEKYIKDERENWLGEVINKKTTDMPDIYTLVLPTVEKYDGGYRIRNRRPEEIMRLEEFNIPLEPTTF